MSKSQSHLRPYSSAVFDGISRAASRAMLYPVGYKEGDFSKPQIGVASTWSMVTPCNMHIDQLAREAALGIDSAGGKATIFNTITISDGISMGTEGMKYSLVSREVIADSIETVVGCQGFDGYVAIGGCDKNMPACIMSIVRMNRAAVFVYGGTILPGCLSKRQLDVVSVFEAVGQCGVRCCRARCDSARERFHRGTARRQERSRRIGLQSEGAGRQMTQKKSLRSPSEL